MVRVRRVCGPGPGHGAPVAAGVGSAARQSAWTQASRMRGTSGLLWRLGVDADVPVTLRPSAIRPRQAPSKPWRDESRTCEPQ
jgi:hypothetical protein